MQWADLFRVKDCWPSEAVITAARGRTAVQGRQRPSDTVPPSARNRAADGQTRAWACP
ncbi:hypothethical protein (plasmid) [Ralstonia solanacearum CMR15]|nr:hypothethical protein [Ralstonia solanacearum CMR15]